MKNYKKITVITLMLFIMASVSHAKLSQPDYTLYGTATWFGAPLPKGSEITIYLESQLLTAAKYSLGSDENLGGLYALRVPMDDIDPRRFGQARPGDPAKVFINGALVAEILIGAYGKADRLDLDPLTLADTTSILNVTQAQKLEGDSGSSLIDVTVSLTAASDSDVSVNWETADVLEGALGGDACEFDVDFINKTGTVNIPSNSLLASLTVEICGDTLIEDSETFEILLTQPINAVIQFDRGTVTILDDDGLPEIRGFDMVVFEPTSGQLTQGFQLEISRAFPQVISFDYTTIADSASSGSDYIQKSGSISIPANQQQVFIPVEFLADGVVEGIEVMKMQISNVSNARPVTPIFNLNAFIMDSDREQQTIHDNEVTDATVPDLLRPSDIVISSNDKHVYVSSLVGDGSILQFSFNHGTLNYTSTYNNTTVGFETAKFKLIRQVELTPNGKYLYASASGDNSISAFSIDAVTGGLTFVANFDESIPSSFGIQGVYGLSISGDGSHLYASGSDSDSIAAFEIDDATGMLTFLEAEVLGINDATDSGDTVTFMDRPIKLDVSPDGKNVYVAADLSSSVVSFERDAITGKLNYKASFKSGVSGVVGLGGAADVLVGLDNKNVYVLGQSDDSVAIFARATDGTLSFTKTLSKTNPDFIGLESPTALISSEANDRIYTLGLDDSTMVSFIKDNTGDLEFADFEQDGVNGVDKLNGPIGLDITSNGSWVIVAAAIDNALVVFSTHVPESPIMFKDGFED